MLNKEKLFSVEKSLPAGLGVRSETGLQYFRRRDDAHPSFSHVRYLIESFLDTCSH